MASNLSSNSPSSKKDSRELVVVLESGRSKHLSYAAFCLIAGVLLLWKFGVIAQGVGVFLVAMAVHQGTRAAQTYLHPPGTFRVEGSAIRLPTGLCKGDDLELSRDELQHAFFLRRAVPWTQAGPLLVVEARGKAYSYPRDWFASDSDQRRVERALNSSRS